MNPRDTLWLGLKGMSARRLRTALTVLSVMIGVAAIVALLSITTGVSNSISQSLSRIGPTTLFVTPAQGTIFTDADVAEIESFPNVSSVVPILRFSATGSISGTSESVSVIGIDNSSLNGTIGGINLYSGSMFNDSSGPTALVGYDVAFPNTGQTVPSVTLNEPMYLSTTQSGGSPQEITVLPVGILNSYGTALFISPDSSIFVPLKEAESMLNKYSYNVLIVKATNTSTVAALDTLLTNVYGSRASVLSVQQLTSTVSSIIGSISLLLAGIASISLIVAGISILSIMMVSVSERVHEIGILKSIGFRQRDVMLLFLSEALIIGIIGGALGSAVGASASYVIPSVFSSAGGSPQTGSAVSGGQAQTASAPVGGGRGGFFVSGESSPAARSFSGSGGLPSYTPEISPTVIGLAILLAILVSIIASLYPAWKASRIDPIKALRAE